MQLVSRRITLAAAALSLAFAAPHAPAADSDPKSSGHAWATKVEKPGLKNLHRVTDRLYRGAQPTEEGMRQLEAMGIRTIVSFRAFNSDKDEVENTRLKTHRISFKT